MIAFLAKLVIKPDMKEPFEKAQVELRELTYANEPDTPVYELFRSQESPETYFCVATFKDQAAFDFHMQTDFHDRLVPIIIDCLASEMELSFYDVVV
jgi:quinol monooxygenase YgiN